MKDLYNKNCKTSVKETEDINEKLSLDHGLKELKLLKMTILPKTT